MKKTGQMALISVSILFTVIESIFSDERFTEGIGDFFIATFIAWFVGWQYDKLKYDQLRRKRSEANYKQLIEMLPESVIIHRNNVILYVNKAAEAMLGARRKEELEGRSLLEFMDDGYRKQAAGHSQKVSQESIFLLNAVYRLTCLNLRTIFFEFSSLNIVFEGQDAILYIGKDITDKREQTQSLLQKSEKLAVVGQLAAGIAHEIRNPLTSIKGFIQIVQADIEHRDHKEFLGIVLGELERINAIVGEFLVLAKPNVVKFSRVHIKPLLDDVVSLISSQAIMDNVQITVACTDDIPDIICEENQLKQVFVNILKNAIEAMPDGGLIQVEIKKNSDKNVALSFIDQGVGIPEDRIPTLGEPFYTTKEKGTGLGLMTCLKIIENHKGSFNISSRVGEGTTIDIVLPAAAPNLLKRDKKAAWSLKEDSTLGSF
ncbi:ATP-binding protein [Domibacillus indicus]|uniref:ATP-binding protein n=1 Tax=Domibacillus indicus TaxID=1437523 RepID=UPI000617F35C|nr:ATP-binding protein [Domibacillus indicus]